MRQKHRHHVMATLLGLAALGATGRGVVVPEAQAVPSIRDVRDTVQALPVSLEQGRNTVRIRKGEELQLLRLYHDNGNAWSWHEFVAFEACPGGGDMCAVPFKDANGKPYHLIDTLHADEDALTVVGFYSVQSAQGRWNLFMIRMERPMQGSPYEVAPTTAHVSLFKLAPAHPEVGEGENNYFQEIAALPVGNYCNSSVALATFLNQPLPAGTAPDGCLR